MSVSPELTEGLAAVKRELAAVVIFGAILIPLVGYFLDEGRGLAVLTAYGIGGAFWVRTRARGLILAARQRGGADEPDNGA